MADSPHFPTWRRYVARSTETADERDQRFTMHAALGFTLATMIGVGLLVLAPIMVFQSWGDSWNAGPFDDYGLGGVISFGVLLASLAGLGVGLVAYVLWKTLLVSPRRFGFFPGAQVGLFLALLLCIPLLLFLQFSFFQDHPESTAPTDLPAKDAALLITAMFVVPTGLVGAAVGGLIGSSQLRETLEDDTPAA